MECDFYIRNAKAEDFDIIKKFVQSPRKFFFGPSRRKDPDTSTFFRHYAVYRLLAFENPESDHVVAYAELRNYPFLWALPGEHWLDFLKMHYCLTIPVSVTNTLFFNYCGFFNDFNPILIKSLLREVFFRENQLRFLMIIEPPDRVLLGLSREERQNYYLFEGISEIFYPRVFSIESCPNTQKLHVISRINVIERMSYRQALPEDNDDIIEVIDVERPDLREECGDYYIAEELLKQGIQHNMLIVTEVHNTTAGFVWLNDDVDVLLLLENYEVDMFANLIKYDPNLLYKEMVINVITLEKKPPWKLFTNTAIQEILELEYPSKKLLADLSLTTLSSQRNMRVVSISGLITTVDEVYYVRQNYCRNLRKITQRINNSLHYSYRYEKAVDLWFNVSESLLSEIDVALPDHNFNIFALQLFGMHQNNDIRRLYRLILAAFAAYPDRDYCLFSVPVGTPLTKNLRYLLKYFVRMSSRPRCQIQDELYITHRSSIYGEVTLHDVRYEDVIVMENIMLYNVPHLYDTMIDKRLHDSISTKRSSVMSSQEWEADIVHYILEDVFNNEFTNFTIKTIRCGRSEGSMENTTLVGFIILRPFQHIHLLKRTHFRFPKKNWFAHHFAEIVTMRLHPFYHHQVDLIFRELARLTNYFEYYYLQVMKGDAITLPNDLVHFMQPIEPKPFKAISKATQIDADSELASSSTFYKSVNYIKDYYAVYHHNLRPIEYCGSDKPLVILGFSPICKSFLRTIIFSWHMPGSKIEQSSCCVPQLKVVVITPSGVMDAEYDKHFVCDSCTMKGITCYTDSSNWSDYVKDVTNRMDVRKYIHFVCGQIKEIDRAAHHIIFNNNCHIYYDNLLLLCDTNFGCPRHISQDVLPPNYVQINTRLDRILTLHKIELFKKELESVEGKCIVIYGAHLRTFEFINFLLDHGIEASCILLVVPYQKGVHISQSIFNQPVADERLEVILQDMVCDMGVKVEIDLVFSHWVCYADDSNISKVYFESTNGESREILCDMFVCFYETYIDPFLVKVLNNADIKMNQRNILVDDDFRTNDPHIYAMGNFMEHKVEPNHQYKFVSHKEAAEKLIYKLGLIPVQLETPYEPKFSQPNSCEVRLPMNYTIFKATVPKRFMLNCLDNEFTHSLITYDGTFSRVRLNPFGIVEEITVVTQRKMSFEFLLHFVGKHELLLNRLRARWCNEEITCFLDYFQEPWTELLLHENFESLQEENRKLMMPLAQRFMDLNIERKERKRQFKQRAKELKLENKLEEAFIKFIRQHRADIKNPIALPEDFPKQK